MCDKSGHDITKCLVAIEVECSFRPAGHTDLLCVEPALKHERYFKSCLVVVSVMDVQLASFGSWLSCILVMLLFCHAMYHMSPCRMVLFLCLNT